MVDHSRFPRAHASYLAALPSTRLIPNLRVFASLTMTRALLFQRRRAVGADLGCDNAYVFCHSERSEESRTVRIRYALGWRSIRKRSALNSHRL